MADRQRGPDGKYLTDDGTFDPGPYRNPTRVEGEDMDVAERAARRGGSDFHAERKTGDMVAVRKRLRAKLKKAPNGFSTQHAASSLTEKIE